jgi:hypothetical protein
MCSIHIPTSTIGDTARCGLGSHKPKEIVRVYLAPPKFGALDFLAKVAALSRRRNGFETRMPYQNYAAQIETGNLCRVCGNDLRITGGLVAYNKQGGAAKLESRGGL